MHCEFDYSPLNISSFALSCLPIDVQCSEFPYRP